MYYYERSGEKKKCFFRFLSFDWKLFLTEHDGEKFFRLDVLDESLTVDLLDALVGLLLHHPLEHFALVEKIT